MAYSCNWENSITLGPCSNRPAGDHEWSFKPNGWITEIKLRRGGVLIESITFKSIDEKGNIETSNKFGGDAGGTEHVISLNWPEEYLMKVSGTLVTYAEFPGIGSLCFETNLKKYGPFGHTDGTPFEFSVKDGVIAGFYGRFGIYINTIGVYVKRSAELFTPSRQVHIVTPKNISYNWKNYITIVPMGGEGGDKKWSFKPNGGITEIKIGYAAVIDSISFKSVDENGMITSSEKFGGNVWKNEEIISLNWPKEYLMKICGTQRTYANGYCIESLCFHTNLNKYGPFGPSNGTSFELCMKDGVIVGFHGRCGIYIDAIGVYVKNYADLFSPSCKVQKMIPKNYADMFSPPSQVQIKTIPQNSADLFGPSSQAQILTPQVDTGKMMNMDTPRELGPWGGNDTGKPWDDGVFLDINRVDVHVEKGILLGIQFRYQTKNGNSIKSERHGEKSGDAIHRIKLDSSSEYLIGIMGYYRPTEGNGGFEAVCSLSFYTNKGKYGPFGDQIGMFFSSPVTNGKIIGFHGRSGDYLDALGVHMEYS